MKEPIRYDHLYQTQVKACATCKWGKRTEKNEVICVNHSSDQYADFVDRGFQCKEWD